METKPDRPRAGTAVNVAIIATAVLIIGLFCGRGLEMANERAPRPKWAPCDFHAHLRIADRDKRLMSCRDCGTVMDGTSDWWWHEWETLLKAADEGRLK